VSTLDHPSKRLIIQLRIRIQIEHIPERGHRILDLLDLEVQRPSHDMHRVPREVAALAALAREMQVDELLELLPAVDDPLVWP